MRSRQILEGASFNCEALLVMGKAFDQGWLEIAHHFAGDEEQIDRARTRLAHAVLIAADDSCRDVVRIKSEALEILALSFRDRLPTILEKQAQVA